MNLIDLNSIELFYVIYQTFVNNWFINS